MKKVVCHWVLTEQQKEEHVQISKEILKLLNDGGHCIISQIVMGDETYKPFFVVPTCQESEIGVFEDDPMPTSSNEKAKYDFFFRSTGLVKAIKLEGQKAETANWYTTKCPSRNSPKSGC
ncbi:uncharacterized protein TNCV_683561 [Trichonephila clavipes]|nr:uncharacterized protein TNCV_683561 [Trichonephila clavipes]